MTVVLIVSVLVAFFFQSLAAEVLTRLSEWLYPYQETKLGSIGWALAPHPLSFGLYILPLTTIGISFTYIFFKKRIRSSNKALKEGTPTSGAP